MAPPPDQDTAWLFHGNLAPSGKEKQIKFAENGFEQCMWFVLPSSVTAMALHLFEEVSLQWHL